MTWMRPLQDGPAIEKGIPIPPRPNRGKKGMVQTLRRLEIGDSTLLPTKRNTVGSLIRAAGLIGCTTLRTERKGVRVWRIK